MDEALVRILLKLGVVAAVTALPASFEEASRLLAAWLQAPTEAMPAAKHRGAPRTDLVGARFAVRSSAAESAVDRIQPVWTARGLFVSLMIAIASAL